MRPISILIALVVAASLYGLTFERETLLRVAGAAPAAIGAETADSPVATRDAVGVVTMISDAQEIDGAVILRGRTQAMREVAVSAETGGRVISEPLRKGAEVARGDVLCELDPGTRDASLAEAEARLAEARAARPQSRAQVRSAEAQLNEAEINLNAAARLSEDGFASATRVASSEAQVELARAAVETAKGGLESVEAGIRSAEAAVASARKDMERLTIRAPFAGLLESDTAELGSLMQAGSLCATVIQLDPILLVGFVPETAVEAVRVGADAQARLASGASATGKVSFLSRSADPDTRTFRTEITVENADQTIRDGQTAEIAIRSDGRAAHLLPQSALTLDDAGTLGVRIVDEQDGVDVARFAPVELVRDTARGVFVAGLPQTVQVIVVGQEYVIDGVPVDPTPREQVE
ncbi:efflux RND transporter periplasmic adaptor subunit [Palleronia sediminis]|uniref:Efflux RND transporter periplasmic adaptor subunit n=1 Tax=Palleronia sediminis TaxID=2547833 RepID=A0A4V6PP51_9RHOB|nr:efflux RND transporter periplasmic adaptor subunit [Palleronia sediminis]TDL78139.1 efflux RND transporter periplasmic adaptor subunit [Palleronia sediminis]